MKVQRQRGAVLVVSLVLLVVLTLFVVSSTQIAGDPALRPALHQAQVSDTFLDGHLNHLILLLCCADGPKHPPA